MLRSIAAPILTLALFTCAGLQNGCGDDDDDGAPLDGGGSGPDARPPDDGEGEGGVRTDAGRIDSGMRDAAPPDDHDGGEDDGGDDGPVDTAFYPVDDGARWVYRHAGGSNTWDEEVTIRDTEYMGEPAFLLSDTPGPSGNRSESILMRLGTQILRVHRKEFSGNTLELTADYDPGFVRFDHAWPSRPEGYEETLGYDRIERDAQGTTTADGARSHRYTVEALADTVTVPAGEFDGCLRMRRSRVRAAGSATVEGDEDLFWFCPGIGKVREQDQVSGESEELVSCTIPNGSCP